MNLSDTFYVALCMTVLILGVVYWFWTQNQYIQRKLNLLENIVYEMKSSIHYSAPDPIDKVLYEAAVADMPAHVSMPAQLPVPLPEDDVDAILDSLTGVESDDNLHDYADNDAHIASDELGGSIDAEEVVDLQSGGIGSGISDDVSDTNNESVLNAMGLKELKELAKQKGVSGAKAMRKHELIAAIRASTINISPFEIREATLELN
jgi:hypothetical protein